MSKLVIDVSEFQEEIDWDKVKKAGVKGAILRVGYGMDYPSQDDQYIERNIEECERVGLPIGVYLFSYADSTAKASSEAEHTLRLVAGHKLPLGVWYDIEDNKTSGSVSKSTLTNIINTYCNIIKDAGYEAGIYANLNWLENKIESSVQEKWTIWVAQYYKECQYEKPYVMWQYTSEGKVDGIKGNVDMNYYYGDIEEVPENKPSKPVTGIICNDEVYKWQKIMNDVYDAGLELDGCFGPLCEQAALNHYLYYRSPIMNNDYVLYFQKLMNKKGYDLALDSMFGPDCRAKTIQLQKKYNLTVDGCAGAEVMKVLLK